MARRAQPRRYKTKVCGECGRMQLQPNWGRHWETFHPEMTPIEWKPGTPWPKSFRINPCCDNLEDYLDGADPINL